MTETIALFGATGATGSHVLSIALEKGYKVQAMARNPSKVTVEHTNLTVIPGDFENEDAIKSTIAGATYVVCCAGGNIKVKPYVKLMEPFVTEKLWPLMANEPSVKVFSYQAGAFSPKPGKSRSMGMKMMKSLVNCMINLGPMIDDNDAVIEFMAANKKSFDVIVTRPGGLKEAKSETELVASATSSMSAMITFVDLATFTLDAIKDPSLYGTYPYPMPKSK